jgi:hypothetical protein
VRAVNPGNYYCGNWGTLAECANVTGDLMFDLRGTSTPAAVKKPEIR